MLRKKFLEIEISEKESYTIYDDGVFYSHQSDEDENPTDIPQYLFELRDFVLENYKEMKHQVGAGNYSHTLRLR